MITFEDASVLLEVEETVNDSDKLFTVPTGRKWKILSIWIEFVTTGTVGNRYLTIQLRDTADDVIYEVQSAAIAESGSEMLILLPGLYQADLSGATNRDILPLPNPCILEAGFDIHIYDNAAVDATADDMIIQMLVQELPL